MSHRKRLPVHPKAMIVKPGTATGPREIFSTKGLPETARSLKPPFIVSVSPEPQRVGILGQERNPRPATKLPDRDGSYGYLNSWNVK